MDATIQTTALTHHGAKRMLQAAVEAAEKSGQPQCIVIVEASGQLIAEIRMTGAKFLSRKSAKSKALTAASLGVPSADAPDAVRPAIGAATGGAVTVLPGGLPIIVDGVLVGGIGVGSGTGAQDIDVAQAALAAIGAPL
ncbi:GlcG/HbpS family heme-binding protein [Loktanella agnita]|uniref:GlcG/HbpS family heme-binding protein n=1 Tax=Loktanella agnita TaxID=287097 RepID=UPI003985CBC2